MTSSQCPSHLRPSREAALSIVLTPISTHYANTIKPQRLHTNPTAVMVSRVPSTLPHTRATRVMLARRGTAMRCRAVTRAIGIVMLVHWGLHGLNSHLSGRMLGVGGLDGRRGVISLAAEWEVGSIGRQIVEMREEIVEK